MTERERWERLERQAVEDFLAGDYRSPCPALLCPRCGSDRAEDSSAGMSCGRCGAVWSAR